MPVLRAALFAGLVALASGPGAAQTLKLATGKGYEPFTDPDLPQGGLAAEVVRAALAQQGYAVELAFMPWDRAYHRTVKAQIDGTFPYVQTAERRAQVRYSRPLFRVKAEVISSAEQPVRFDGTQASLAGKTVCIPEGYAPQALLKVLLRQGKLTPTRPQKLKRCPQLVKLGRADFFAVNNFVRPSLFADHGFQRSAFHVAQKPLQVNTLHFIVGRSHPRSTELIEAFNSGLKALRDEGKYNRLVQRRVGVSP